MLNEERLASNGRIALFIGNSGLYGLLLQMASKYLFNSGTFLETMASPSYSKVHAAWDFYYTEGYILTSIIVSVVEIFSSTFIGQT
jgi:hypothetical protein